MTAEVAGGELRGIGARLRAAREKRGLTLLQAAERLHLDARIVQALESEDFAALGADVYVRGHIRRYADAVGESPLQLQELYSGHAQSPPPDLTRIPRGEPGHGSRLLLPGLLLIMGVALAGLLWWLLTLPGEKAHPLPADRTPAASSQASPGSEAAGDALASEPPAAAGDASGAAAPRLPQARLDLAFSASSWVEISDAQGHRLLHGLIEAGSTRTLGGSAPLLIVLGNASAVSLRLNGQPVPLSALARRDGSAHVLIDAAGHASVAPPRLAHGD